MDALDFSGWRTLASRSPADAAGELHRRAGDFLSPDQRRAVIAWLPSQEALVSAFASARPDSPLCGVPCFFKDLFDLSDVPTFAGSTFLPEVRPLPEADCAMAKAARETGMICAGKTHLHEFAYGNTGENPHYGDCEHPHFPGRTTGGSSSGSAAAVAAGIVPLAFGTDTAGSIRGPAAFCGLFGIRLTPGHPWMRSVFPLAQSFDTPGWFAANAGDMRDAISALVGMGSIGRKLNGCYLEFGELDGDVALACASAATRICAAADADTRSGLKQAFANSTQAYSVLSSTEAAKVHAPWLDTHRPRYSPAVWERIDRGRRWPDDELAVAAMTRTMLKATLTSYFLTYDFLVTPASATPALTKAECTPHNRTRLLDLAAPASLAGLPVLSLPVPLPSGMTTGLQVVVGDIHSPVIPWVLNLWKQLEPHRRR